MSAGDALQSWGPPILSVVLAGGIGGFLKVIFDRKLTKATADKTAVEGDVALSQEQREWVRDERANAKERIAAADARMTAAEAKADLAEAKAEALERKVDDLEAQVASLLLRLSRCSGGEWCPMKTDLEPGTA